jgi:predicted phosphodiesterase
MSPLTRSVGRASRTAALSLLFSPCAIGGWAHAQQTTQQVVAGVDEPLSFAVLGHVRRTPEDTFYYQLEELVAEVAEAAPDLVVLTGDIIWGDVRVNPADRARVTAEWEAIDDTLAAIGAPVVRVPGNHDISDLVTRDIYVERYGSPQQTFDIGRTRFVLISSAWVPEDGDTRKRLAVRGQDLDSAEVAFLRESLPGDGSYDHAFVFMHHLLWWQEEGGPWWQDVHPVLAQGKVRAVFSGDMGPTKYSHMRRDGVDYYQSSVAPDPGVKMLRGHEWNRLLAQQLDNWLLVTVDGPTVRVDVETIGETEAGGHWTPDRWRAVYGTTKRPRQPLARDHFDALVATRSGLYAVVGALVAVFLLGLTAAVAFRLTGRP